MSNVSNRLQDKHLHNLEMKVINLFNALMDIDLIIPYVMVGGKRMDTLSYYQHVTDEFHKAKDELWEYKQSMLQAV